MKTKANIQGCNSSREDAPREGPRPPRTKTPRSEPISTAPRETGRSRPWIALFAGIAGGLSLLLLGGCTSCGQCHHGGGDTRSSCCDGHADGGGCRHGGGQGTCTGGACGGGAGGLGSGACGAKPAETGYKK